VKRKQTFGHIVITAMFLWSALLCHFEASSLKDEGDLTAAIIYWICGFTAIMGALRFKIAELVYGIIAFKNHKKK
jgi:hypothetical protein